MNTIKIFLTESGRIAELRKDFPLYQGQYQNVLLNVYVPTSILAPEFELQHYIGQMSGAEAPTDYTLDEFVLQMTGRTYEVGDVIEFYNTLDDTYTLYVRNSLEWGGQEVSGFGTFNEIAGTSVKIGVTATKPNGLVYKSKSYFMRYLKTLTYNNAEYALYERKLPKEFTAFEGHGANAPVMIINVVNIDTENDYVSSYVTSQTCALDVMRSTVLDGDEPIEASDLERLEAEIGTLLGEIDLKQDKTDENLTTSNKTVVGAINGLNAQVAENVADIANAEAEIAELRETLETSRDYIGTMTVGAMPTSEQLDAYVYSIEERVPKNGDTIIVILQVAGGTDKNYEYFYGRSGWDYYEIPAMEQAANGTKGLVQGTYNIGSTNNTLVSIVGGEIVAIYIKNGDGAYVDIRTAINAATSEIGKILDGTTAVSKAIQAVSDGAGNNIVDTYLTKALGVTQAQLRAYALPRAFNDVAYLAANNEYSNELPTTNLPIYTATSTSVGETTLFTAVKEYEGVEFELGSKNSYSAEFFVAADVAANYVFKLTTQVYDGEEWITACVEQTNALPLAVNTATKVSFASNLDSLTEVISLPVPAKVRQTLSVATTTSATTAFSVYSNSTYPSKFFLNTNTTVIYTQQGALGEIVNCQSTLTVDSGANKYTLSITTAAPLSDNVLCLIPVFSDGTGMGLSDNAVVDCEINGVPATLFTPFNFTQTGTSPTTRGMLKTCFWYQYSSNLFAGLLIGIYTGQGVLGILGANFDLLPTINGVKQYGTSEIKTGEAGAATLYAANWSGSTYTLTVSGLGANDSIFIRPATSGDKALYEAAEIFDTAGTGSVTFTATTIPSSNIDLLYFIVRGA